MRTRDSTRPAGDRGRRTNRGARGPGDAAAVFAALGDRTRLALVARMGEGGPQSVTRLTRRSGISRQGVTKHLAVLERAGLARAQRRGRERLWQIDPARLELTRRYLDAIAAQWDVALARLKVFVEG